MWVSPDMSASLDRRSFLVAMTGSIGLSRTSCEEGEAGVVPLPIDIVHRRVVTDGPDSPFSYYEVVFPLTSYNRLLYREPMHPERDFVINGGRCNVQRYGFYLSDDHRKRRLVHEGRVMQLFEVGDRWLSLVARFDAGELIEVNGVEPTG